MRTGPPRLATESVRTYGLRLDLRQVGDPDGVVTARMAEFCLRVVRASTHLISHRFYRGCEPLVPRHISVLCDEPRSILPLLLSRSDRLQQSDGPGIDDA
jgi:hypothetical protein